MQVGPVISGEDRLPEPAVGRQMTVRRASVIGVVDPADKSYSRDVRDRGAPSRLEARRKILAGIRGGLMRKTTRAVRSHAAASLRRRERCERETRVCVSSAIPFNRADGSIQIDSRMKLSVRRDTKCLADGNRMAAVNIRAGPSGQLTPASLCLGHGSLSSSSNQSPDRNRSSAGWAENDADRSA